MILIVISALGMETGGIGNQKKNQDHSDYSIVKINMNTKKSPGVQRRLAVPQSSIKDHQP